MTKYLFPLFFFTLALTGCSAPEQPKGQPELPAVKLKISTQTVTAEVADTPQTEQIGLMFRTSLPENHGMIFVYAQPQQMSFWMKNTLIPLSIAFIDASGKIVEIYDMKPHDETTIRSKSSALVYALEMTQGWFQKNNIQPGTKIDGLPPLPVAGN